MYVQFTKETSNPLIKSLTMSTAFFAILFDLKKVHFLKVKTQFYPWLSMLHVTHNVQKVITCTTNG